MQKFSLYKQIELFQGTQALVRKKIGDKAADKFFTEARYVVALGSNDFINNYLFPVYADSWTYTGTGFINLLMTTLDQQLTVRRRNFTVSLLSNHPWLYQGKVFQFLEGNRRRNFKFRFYLSSCFSPNISLLTSIN